MPITDFERSKIIEAAQFLERLGYIRTDKPYSIRYSLNNICISIAYPPYSDRSEIDIRFNDRNQVFNVNWMAFVREGIKDYDDKLENVLNLLSFVEKQYFQIIDLEYCIESNKLVDKYVDEHREIFGPDIRDLLNRS